MKNMCLDDLRLVAPSQFPDKEALARASGADDVLERAEVYASLQEAIADCAMVVGTTARARKLPWPELDPRQCAQEVLGLESGNAAIVFGRERAGLTNEEIDCCTHMLTIPANPGYNSLNLASAVQVVGYELLMTARQDDELTRREPEAPPATIAEMERFYTHLEDVMTQTAFLNPDNPRHLMRRLRRLFNRARLDQNEVNILRGLLTAVQPSRNSKE